MTIKFLSFREWCRQAGVSPDGEKCPECKGKKFIPCTCSCGDEHEADCTYCDGKGTVNPALDEYNAQLERDRERIETMGLSA